MMGIDLAKNIFAVPGVDENGKAAMVKRKVARATTAVDQPTAAMSDRHGSLLRWGSSDEYIESTWVTTSASRNPGF